MEDNLQGTIVATNRHLFIVLLIHDHRSVELRVVGPSVSRVKQIVCLVQLQFDHR